MADILVQEKAPDSGSTDPTLEWINGYVFDTPLIEIPNTVFETIPSAADCAATGDIQEIMFGLIEHIFNVQEARKAESASDVLEGMVLTKNTTISLSDSDKLVTSFVVNFTSTVTNPTSGKGIV